MKKELPPIEDKIQQVFLFLENMPGGYHPFHGKWVLEAGDADGLHDILKTALEQNYREGLAVGRYEGIRGFSS